MGVPPALAQPPPTRVFTEAQGDAHVGGLEVGLRGYLVSVRASVAQWKEPPNLLKFRKLHQDRLEPVLFQESSERLFMPFDHHALFIEHRECSCSTTCWSCTTCGDSGMHGFGRGYSTFQERNIGGMVGSLSRLTRTTPGASGISVASMCIGCESATSTLWILYFSSQMPS